MKNIFLSFGRSIDSSLIGLAGVVVLLVFSLTNEYQVTSQHAKAEVGNITQVLEEHVLATLNKTDLLLTEAQRNVRPDDVHSAFGSSTSRHKVLHDLLKTEADSVAEVAVIHVADAHGRYIFSSLDSVPDINIADRGYFQRHRNDAASGLVISAPLVSRTTGKWTIVLSRRISNKDGGFAGIVLAVLDVEYFQKLFRSLDLGSHGSVALYDMDWRLAARYPPSEKDMGNKLSGLTVERYFKQGVTQGDYHTRSLLDGIDRLFSFRQVGGLPLVVIAGVAETDYLSEWHHHIWEYGLGATIFALVVVVLRQRQRRGEVALLKSQEDLRTIADYTYDWEYWEGPQRELLYISPSCERITGYSQAEFMADSGLLYRIVHPDDRHLMQEHLDNVSGQHLDSIDFRIARRDGGICWIAHGCQAVYGVGGKYLGRRASNRDITERKKIEAEIRIAATAFESQEGILISDANNIVLRVNKAFTAITGYSADEIVGRDPSILSSGRQGANFYAAMWKSINATGAWEGEIWNRRKNGEIYPEHLTITAVKDQDGTVVNYVASLADITKSKLAEEEIRNLAFFDPLTRLPNRRLLQDRLQQALASSGRSGKEGALLFIDLDNFKTLNDTLGHDIGDILLQQVAQRLESCVRQGDTVARLGGDEFVVMLEGLSEQRLEAAEQTEMVGEKILDLLNQPYRLGRHEYHSTPSIGATLFIDYQQPIENLLKQADIAMYQAKTAGRNTLRFFDPRMQETIKVRAALESELRSALELGQFRLYYQMQVDSAGRRLGAEALIRWLHPERGLVSPVEFIPLAEETGLILPIGQWVLETACAQLKSWQQNAETRELLLSVNVSSKQFRQPQFATLVSKIVRQYGIDPKLLKFELTESMLLDNIDDTITTMNALKEVGVRISLDDFGTGYSSLQYLKRLPITQLKIDQSFVRDIAVDSSDKAIVSTVIAMAHSLGLDVIAEGVETEVQRKFLFNMGCIHYQGYLFGKPVPVEQFGEFPE